MDKPPPRPMAPKPMLCPEPMDVNPSIGTRQSIYINRHQLKSRLSPLIAPQPEKKQRNFNMESDETNNDGPDDTDYEQAIDNYETEDNYDQTLDEHIEFSHQEDPQDKTDQEFSNIHFLE